jgi:hypothetical protein
MLKNKLLRLKPMHAMQFIGSSLHIISITLRVIYSSGQAELERLVRRAKPVAQQL